jgi:hypothetical protein
VLALAAERAVQKFFAAGGFLSDMGQFSLVTGCKSLVKAKNSAYNHMLPEIKRNARTINRPGVFSNAALDASSPVGQHFVDQAVLYRFFADMKRSRSVSLAICSTAGRCARP